MTFENKMESAVKRSSSISFQLKYNWHWTVDTSILKECPTVSQTSIIHESTGKDVLFYISYLL